jgi:hypothetical protein
LRKGLALVLEEMTRAAQHREAPTVEAARCRQTLLMRNLKAPDARFVAVFRGEPRLENGQARVQA